MMLIVQRVCEVSCSAENVEAEFLAPLCME